MDKHFIVIFASQRTGSTLFCSDLNSIGLGDPQEWGNRIYRRPHGKLNPDFSFQGLYQYCRSETEVGEIFALKTMVDYTPEFVWAINPGLNGLSPHTDEDHHVEVMKLFFQKLKEDFASVIPFVVTRDEILDCAISNAVSVMSNVHGSGQSRYREFVGQGGYSTLDFNRVVQSTLEFLPKVYRENRILHKLKDDFPDGCLHVEYTDLANNPEGVFLEVSNYLTQYGIKLKSDSFNRKSKKIVPTGFAGEIKEKINAVLFD